jgi:hypothetical protein
MQVTYPTCWAASSMFRAVYALVAILESWIWLGSEFSGRLHCDICTEGKERVVISVEGEGSWAVAVCEFECRAEEWIGASRTGEETLKYWTRRQESWAPKSRRVHVRKATHAALTVQSMARDCLKRRNRPSFKPISSHQAVM